MNLEQIQRALKVGSPKPWRIDPRYPRMVLDANGDNTCTALLAEDAETIVLLVNGVTDLLERIDDLERKPQTNSSGTSVSPEGVYGNSDRPYPR